MRVSMAVPMMVVVIVSMIMPMVPILEQPGACEIDGQADGRDGDRLIVVDRRGSHQPLHRLVQHQGGHPGQEQGARVAAQHLDLPGSESEAPVIGITPRRAVRQHRQPERQRMRAHVPPVGQQRHRIEDVAAKDLDHHHRRGKHDRPAGIAFGQGVALVEDVAVRPILGSGVCRHDAACAGVVIYYTPV